MHKSVLILFISFFLFGVSNTKAQVDVKLYADTNHIRIGEQVNVKLVLINHADNSPEVTWPFAMDTLSKGIEVLEVLAVDTQKYEEETIFTQEWHLTSFDTGFQEVPSFEIIVNGEEQKTEPFLIQVETVKIDTTQAIKDIKGVQDVPISIFEWMKYHWKWFAGLAILVILLFGVYLIIKNKNKELVFSEKPNEPAIPPHLFALERLDKLNEGKWWQQGDVKFYHSSISEILREYLEHEFDFPALEQTTREVNRSITLTTVDKEQQIHLQKILILSDLVKYAKEKPSTEDNKDMMSLAIEFVNKTKPMLIEQTEKEEVIDEA